MRKSVEKFRLQVRIEVVLSLSCLVFQATADGIELRREVICEKSNGSDACEEPADAESALVGEFTIDGHLCEVGLC